MTETRREEVARLGRESLEILVVSYAMDDAQRARELERNVLALLSAPDDIADVGNMVAQEWLAELRQSADRPDQRPGAEITDLGRAQRSRDQQRLALLRRLLSAPGKEKQGVIQQTADDRP